MKWNSSVDASVVGKDYHEGKVKENEPTQHPWVDDERYKPYLEEWENDTRIKIEFLKI